MKKTKNNKKLIENIDTAKVYEPIDAIKILKENSYTKFEESLEVSINLGIDSNKTDQNIRGVISLPKGSGKSVNVAVLAKGDKKEEAKKAIQVILKYIGEKKWTVKKFTSVIKLKNRSIIYE